MKVTYTCDVCNTTYPTEAQALECENTVGGFPWSFQVGDIVTARYGFGWFNGDPRWLANPELKETSFDGAVHHRARQICPTHPGQNCFGSCCTWGFYYVVTAITLRKNSHRVIYHVATGAMTGEQGYSNGVTGPDHKSLTLATNPPEFVVADSKRFLGQTFPEGRLL